MELMTVAALAIAFIIVTFSASKRRYSSKKGKRAKVRSVGSRKHPGNNWGMAVHENQISAIAKVDFERIKIMNKSEFRVFKALETIAAELAQGHRVMAQVSLGEIIKPKNNSGDWKLNKDAFASINSKRLDFAVIDKFGFVALAVEYQGEGHYSDDAFKRDAVKREALRKANVSFLEVPKGMSPSELKQSINRLLNASA